MFVAAEVLHEGQTFFERCDPFFLRQRSTIKETSSYQPPKTEKTAALIIKAAVEIYLGMKNDCPAAAFFLFCRWADAISIML